MSRKTILNNIIEIMQQKKLETPKSNDDNDPKRKRNWQNETRPPNYIIKRKKLVKSMQQR